MAQLLIVDSACAPSEELLTLLACIGHHVRYAVDGDVGLSTLREAPADLVIADIVSGRRVAAMIRALGAAVGVRILLTGDGPHLAQMAQACGVKSTLRKPYTAAEFGRAVVEILR